MNQVQILFLKFPNVARGTGLWGKRCHGRCEKVGKMGAALALVPSTGEFSLQTRGKISPLTELQLASEWTITCISRAEKHLQLSRTMSAFQKGVQCLFFFFFIFKYFMYLLLEKWKGRKKEWEKRRMCFLLHISNQGPGLWPRRVPGLGSAPATLGFAGPRSIHWATPAGASVFSLWKVGYKLLPHRLYSPVKRGHFKC